MRIPAVDHRNIRPYGWIIDPVCVDDDGKGNNYGILLKEKSAGWRIGYLIVREKTISRLENHSDSLETFEPAKGKTVIALAANSSPDKVNVFLLDKPVVIKKGVWHDVAPLTTRSEVKIFENIEVKTAYHCLKKPVIV